MNKQELLQLEKLATLTPKEIEQSQPVIFNQLSEQASISLKTSIQVKLKNAPQEVKDNLVKVDFTPEKLGKLDIKSILIKNLAGTGLPAEKKKELEEETAKLPDLGKLDDILLPDIPVFLNPAFQPELMKAKVYRLSDIVGIPEVKIDKALSKDLNLNSISGQKLERLVKDNVLDDKEAVGLGLASNLYVLLDSSFELTEHIKKTVKINSLEDLITLERSDWLKLVKDSKVELPQDIKQEDYADILYKKVENLFPEISFSNRITKVKIDELSKNLDTLKPLFTLNDKTFGTVSFDSLKKDGFSTSDQTVLRESYESVNRITKLHPGLKIDAVLNDKTLSAAEKGKIVTERIGYWDTFVKNNANINFFSLDYKHDSEDLKLLNFQGVKPDEKEMVLQSVKSMQRVYSFTDDIEHTEAIMAAGFSMGAPFPRFAPARGVAPFVPSPVVPLEFVFFAAKGDPRGNPAGNHQITVRTSSF